MGHGGLQLTQISGQRGAIHLAQGLQTQPTIGFNNDLDLIALLQARLTQAFGREPDREAVAPAANRLLEVMACVS
jgi:hypothetical protein